MEFTFKAYAQLIDHLRNENWSITDYFGCDACERPAILRHDVDFDLKKAAEFAEFEQRSLGVSSSYFVLLTSDFYNLHSKGSMELLRRISDSGHEIGLHFDEQAYSYADGDLGRLAEDVRREAGVLEDIIVRPVRTVSMHRPSKRFLNSDIAIEGIVNTYSKRFFSGFRYVSDSRMHWREDPFAAASAPDAAGLHILTHPVWYRETESSLGSILSEFITRACCERRETLADNITDLDSLMAESEANSE